MLNVIEQEGLIPTPDPVENRSVEGKPHLLYICFARTKILIQTVHQGPIYQNYNLRFDPDLADSQRLQTESEAVKQGVHG
jgi:hypothetical protein